VEDLMSIPAGRTRRSRIQWHDDGSAQRVRGFLFWEDASPLRALGLAAVLGVLSVAAVVSVIQFQRHGGFEEVSTSLVDEARASPEPRDVKTLPAPETPEIAPAVAAKPIEEQPQVTVAASSTQPEPQAPAGVVQPPAPTTAMLTATAASAQAETAQDKVAAIQADEQQQAALEPLTTSDPRWQAAETAAIVAPQPQIADEQQPADAPLAFAPVEMPTAVPLPQPAPRQKKTVVAAVEPEAEVQQASAAETANAKVRSSVFLRSRPADGSKVLVTIPRGSQIQVAAGCRHWCAVTYDGRRGFVYKSFLSR
jgi:hypothetical protein